MGGDGTGRRTLTEALREAPMSAREAVLIAAAIADEVSALHAAGRAHGRVGPDAVELGAGGTASLAGPPMPKTGLLAPLESRRDDLAGVGRVLAAALGWPDGDALPAPIDDLVRRAGASDAPAAVLAEALVRLQREPLAVAALLPVLPVPARRAVGGVLTRMVPSADRRSTGVAAAVVAGAAAVGAVLLLVGTPASAGREPAAIAAPRASAAAAAQDAGVVVADAVPSSVDAVLRSAPERPLPQPRAVTRRTAVSAEAVAAPTPSAVAPTATPTSGTAAPTPTDTATAEPTATPTEPAATAQPTDPAPTETAAPTAPPSTTAPSEAPTASEPTAAPSATEAPAVDPAPATQQPEASPVAG